MRWRLSAALAFGVVTSVTAGVPVHAELPAPGQVVSMAAFKCLEFLALLDEDREAATAVIRWVDGWHAAGARDARFAASDYEKQVQAATAACSRYPKSSLMKVMGGKFR